jgi:3'(2'), 5'-bisphosphate nucleotidase
MFIFVLMEKLPQHFQSAIHIGIKASFILMDYYQGHVESIDKSDGTPVTIADKASSDFIVKSLSEFGYPIICEEIANEPYEIREKWTENWCIDPLDGTKEYLKKNGEFAINIAFISHSKSVFGIIVSPVKREVLYGGTSTGVFILNFDEQGQILSNTKIERSFTKNNPVVLLASRSYDTPATKKFIAEIEKQIGEVTYKQKGSSLKFFDFARGSADIYPRFAPTMEWDIAAGQAILEALGGEILHLVTGKPLVYNKKDLRNPHFIAKSAGLKETLIFNP